MYHNNFVKTLNIDLVYFFISIFPFFLFVFVMIDKAKTHLKD